MRQNHNIYLLDGGEDDDRGGAGGMSIAPSTDAIAEFRALTSNYSAVVRTRRSLETTGGRSSFPEAASAQV
jgi:hypothetical protein